MKKLVILLLFLFMLPYAASATSISGFIGDKGNDSIIIFDKSKSKEAKHTHDVDDNLAAVPSSFWLPVVTIVGIIGIKRRMNR